MSTEGVREAGEPGAGPGRGPGAPSDEELRRQQAAYEAELSRITTTDMMAQAAVSLLNIGARRLAPPSGAEPAGSGAEEGGEGAAVGGGAPRDLEQARDAIDGVKALLDILQRRIPQELGPLRDALSRLQMAYAREIPPGAAKASEERAAGAAGGPAQPSREPPSPQEGEGPGRPGPAESSGRLWVPGR